MVSTLEQLTWDVFTVCEKLSSLKVIPLHSLIFLLSPRTNVLAIILFHWTYALDLTSLYLAEVNEEVVKKGKRKIKE